MARLVLGHDKLTVALNLIETLMAARRVVTVPLAAVQSVAVQDRPLTKGQFMSDVRMGWAAGGAPGQGLATVGPRARYKDGRDFIVVWRNSEAVVVELAPNETGWRLLVVSSSSAHAAAVRVRSAADPV